MGTLLASALVTSIRVTLLDPAPGTTWSDPELLAMLNQGQRYACTLRPDILTVHGPIPMVAGTLQALPAGSTALIRLDHNVVSKKRCRLVDSSLLDAAMQSWPSKTPAVDVLEYSTTPKNRKRFDVYPPNNGGGAVVAHYGVLPSSIASLAAPITLDDEFEMAIVYFVLSEAYATNTKRQDVTKATYYRNSVKELLGMNAISTGALLPKYGVTPGGA